MSNEQLPKDLTILVPQVADNTLNWSTSTVPVPADVLAIDTDKKVIKIGDGVTPFPALQNHAHPGQYAEITHGHYFGYGEKWFRDQPKLWARHTLTNHPELIELDGSVLADERMYRLADVFNSNVELVHVNKAKSMKCSSLVAGQPAPDILFGPEVDLYNTNNLDDQYDTTNLHIRIEADDEFVRVLHEYEFIANRANELHPTADVVSPKRWEIWGSDDPDDTGVLFHVGTNDTPMYPNERRVYTLDTPEKFRHLTLRVISWHIPDAAEEIKMSKGLRRLYFKGRIDCAIALPYIPPIHPDYAWVVPLDDLGVGLKHEDIGDIGITMTDSSLLAANRLPTKGGMLDIHKYGDLYGRIYQMYAAPIPGITTTHVTGTEWHASTDDDSVLVTRPLAEDDLLCMEFNLFTGHLLDRIELEFLEADNYANNLIVEIKTAHGEWVELLNDASTGMQKLSIPVDKLTAAVTTIKVTATAWSDMMVRPHDGMSLRVYGSPDGKFKLPIMASNAGTMYIVAEKRICDVSTDTLLRLQSVVADLQHQLVQLTDRLYQAEKELAEGKLP